MPGRIRALCTNPLTFWVIALSSIAVWSFVPSYKIGWDFINFKDAIVSLQRGHDPYSDAIAVQDVYRSQLAQHPDTAAPLSYVYSPMTLPLLRVVGEAPLKFSGTMYWMAYAAAFAFLIWVGLQWADEKERKVFVYLAPFTVFFPGLLQNDVLFSGNVAIILYGCILAAAMVGWRRGHWMGFYVVAIVASFFKAPMLSVLAIPVLSARKEWGSSFVAGVVGVAMFCMQPLLWPSLFGNYMKILDTMFKLDQDFSSSPAGVLTEMLYRTSSYQILLAGIYLAYAIPVFGVLLFLARRYFAGYLTLKQWAPVMLIGVVLLNPRIIEYDVAPITLPMLLLAWRAFANKSSVQGTAIKMAVLFGIGNLCTIVNLSSVHLAWRWTECALLLSLFATGAKALLVQSRVADFEIAAVEELVFEPELLPEI